MQEPFFQKPTYQTLMSKHLREYIALLFRENQPFAVACSIEYVTFTPALPSSISEKFQESVLFIISGYSFESATLTEEGVFQFEAGFGEENIGSVVSMPLLAIKQLFIEEHPILFNLASPSMETPQPPKNSMEALLRNPKNKKFLKKKES